MLASWLFPADWGRHVANFHASLTAAVWLISVKLLSTMLIAEFEPRLASHEYQVNMASCTSEQANPVPEEHSMKLVLQ